MNFVMMRDSGLFYNVTIGSLQGFIDNNVS